MLQSLLQDLVAPTHAQREYQGALEFKPYADFLPHIGEVVISFSMLEGRMRWCKESLLKTTVDEAYKMEGFVQNFSSRCKFLELIGLPVGRETSTEGEFQGIVDNLFKSNSFRNRLLHNRFVGLSYSLPVGDPSQFKLRKERYAAKPEKRTYEISIADIKQACAENLSLCSDIQRWTLRVRPDAENRVP